MDGTLIDSWATHQSCLRHAAFAAGLAAPSAARLAAAQRPTDVDTVRVLVGDDLFEQAMLAYRCALRVALAEAPPPEIPGARRTVELLRRDGLAVGVCTGRSRQDARALLDATRIDIDLTVAREDVARPKPWPDGLHRSLRLLGLTAGEALFVGDSAADSLQGHAAGVRTLVLGSVGPATTATRLSRLADLLGELRRNTR
jgi:HAD superfamily hydrolase (TIGR01509 family)